MFDVGLFLVCGAVLVMVIIILFYLIITQGGNGHDV